MRGLLFTLGVFILIFSILSTSYAQSDIPYGNEGIMIDYDRQRS